MKKYLIAIFLVGCGSDFTTQEFQVRAKDPQHIDVKLVTIVNEYLDDAIQAGLDVKGISRITSISFVKDLPVGVEGRCYRQFWSDNTMTAEIQLRDTLIKQPIRMKVAMYHEMSHCMFNAEHTTNVIGGLLSEYILSDARYYLNNWSDLVTKLFEEIKRQQPQYIIKEKTIPDTNILKDLK